MSKQPAIVIHVAHDTEAHARSFNEGYEAAVRQGLADDPALAGDWFEGKLREAQAQALRDAAAAAEGMHDPVPPDCREWADWLKARAAAIEADQ
jgi:urease accessory protein UreF